MATSEAVPPQPIVHHTAILSRENEPKSKDWRIRARDFIKNAPPRVAPVHDPPLDACLKAVSPQGIPSSADCYTRRFRMAERKGGLSRICISK